MINMINTFNIYGIRSHFSFRLVSAHFAKVPRLGPKPGSYATGCALITFARRRNQGLNEHVFPRN